MIQTAFLVILPIGTFFTNICVLKLTLSQICLLSGQGVAMRFLPRSSRLVMFVSLGILVLIGTPTVIAQKPLSSKKGYRLVDKLFEEDPAVREQAKDALIKSKDLSMAPALMEAVFFSTHGYREVIEVLESFFNVKHGRNFKAWVSLIGEREDIEPKPGYMEYKARLHGWIDPNLSPFLNDKVPRTIRPQEIIWGGVNKDGIPALMNPPFTSAGEATHLSADESVFGVRINGDARAYPFRIMDWHEMANDVVGGQPVALSFCTLCGAGVLFDTRRPNAAPYTFGSSGFLYRSNKLMYDHQTENLWSNLTGKPVLGNLVSQNIELPVLPLTVTTWGEWLAANPDTKVLSQNTGFDRDYRPGAAYGKYFSSPDLMFPVWKAPPEEPDLANKDAVWVVVADGVRKAYPIKDLKQSPVVLDTIADVGVVLITDATSEAVRAYRSQGRTLKLTNGQLSDESGVTFQRTEDALVGSDGSTLNRLPGHRTFWFSWGAFFPGNEYYRQKP